MNGTWTFSTIYSFTGSESDVCYPWTQLKPGAKKGTLIGAAQYVSPSGAPDGLHGDIFEPTLIGAAQYVRPGHTPDSLYGDVFELRQTGGVWSEQVLHGFSSDKDGAYPFDLEAASDGTIYGITEYGGQNRYGVVFQLTPNRKGYTFSVIYTFLGRKNGDGEAGVGITFDPATGYLYGTTSGGAAPTKVQCSGWSTTATPGRKRCCTVSPAGQMMAQRRNRGRSWIATRAIYGTTLYGGTNNGGTVYEIQPRES